MSKKILSIILSVMLVFAIGAFSVAADAGVYATPEPYTPTQSATEVGLVRYYFLLPDDWCNEYTNEAGIYWWGGTDACNALDGTGGMIKWPGYKMYQYPDNEANVWYCDIPADVEMVVFNNALDGGDVSWDNFEQDRYTKAYQTVDVGTQWYDPGESDNYPDGTESFYDMIYIVNPEMESVSETGHSTFGGEWYYYHGDGQFDTDLNPTYGGKDGEKPHPSEGATEPTPAPTRPAEETTAPAAATTAPAAQTGATSSTASPDSAQPTTVAGNGTIATGSISFALIVLIVAAGVAGFVIVLRKREIEK